MYKCSTQHKINTKFDNIILAGVNTIVPDFVADIPNIAQKCKDAITRVKENTLPQTFQDQTTPPATTTAKTQESKKLERPLQKERGEKRK